MFWLAQFPVLLRGVLPIYYLYITDVVYTIPTSWTSAASPHCATAKRQWSSDCDPINRPHKDRAADRPPHVCVYLFGFFFLFVSLLSPFSNRLATRPTIITIMIIIQKLCCACTYMKYYINYACSSRKRQRPDRIKFTRSRPRHGPTTTSHQRFHQPPFLRMFVHPPPSCTHTPIIRRPHGEVRFCVVGILTGAGWKHFLYYDII